MFNFWLSSCLLCNFKILYQRVIFEFSFIMFFNSLYDIYNRGYCIVASIIKKSFAITINKSNNVFKYKLVKNEAVVTNLSKRCNGTGNTKKLCYLNSMVRFRNVKKQIHINSSKIENDT